MTRLAPAKRLALLLKTAGADSDAAHAELEAAMRDYPLDARLYFLKGSILAGDAEFAAARAAMRRALELAPDYHLARFQLGFLLLTSGDAATAEEIWAPLGVLSRRDPLALFVAGLRALIRDDFAETLRLLKAGIAANRDNDAMNRDMQLIIDTLTAAPASPVDLLLRQAALKTRH